MLMPLSESMGDIGKNPQKLFVTKMQAALILFSSLSFPGIFHLPLSLSPEFRGMSAPLLANMKLVFHFCKGTESRKGVASSGWFLGL